MSTHITRDDTACNTDVIVVGAGPVGLLLADELSTGGVRVTVLEQRAEPSTESRASTLHARTMELFDERGLLPELGPPPEGGKGHFGGIPLDLTAADPDNPHVGQWKAPQTRIEAVLRERVTERGVDLRRDHRVVGIEDRGGGVRVEVIGPGGRSLELSSAYVVGCDGERSTVRRLIGFDFPGSDATKELLRADVEGIEIPNRRFERHPNGLAIASRSPDGITRVMVHEYGSQPRDRGGEPDFAEVAEVWRRVTGEDIGDGTPIWVNAFDNTSRQASSYRRGRVLLAGDAAHVQLPVGGQAMNLGLQDAADLGAKLAAQFGDRPDEGLLDSYHDVRHPVGRRALTNIEAQAQILLGGPEVNALRDVVSELLELEPVRGHLAEAISGLDTPYPVRPTPNRRRTNPTHTHRRTEMGKLAGRTALVTGSSRGIGRATALRLAGEGALVAVHYTQNREAADEVVATIEKDGGRAFTVRADLGVTGDVHELFLGLEQGLKERTGTTDLNILVNNAGVMGGVAPEEITPEQFDRLYAVNAKAPFFIVQRALDNLTDGGRIVNISSGLTRFANPQEVAYAMTKGAVDQLTLHYAKHLGARGITVNSVGPGITNNGTPVFDNPEAVQQMAAMSVFNRVGEGADIADAVAFLASEDARWVTGSYLDASGGTLLGG